MWSSIYREKFCPFSVRRDNILHMPLMHFMAYYKSLALGLSPASPKNLSYLVETTGMVSSGA